MDNQKTGFFDESPNVRSSIRLYSFLMELFYFGFIIYWVRLGHNIDLMFLYFPEQLLLFLLL